MSYEQRKIYREQELKKQRLSKLYKKRAQIVPAQQDAINVLEREWIQYVREKRILTLKSFYLIDLYLPEYRMCIEIDWSTHDLPAQQEKDRIRDAWLKNNGYWVFRIKIETVKGSFWRKLKHSMKVRKWILEEKKQEQNNPW